MTTVREWLKKDDFTLTMSSGFFAFFAHLGFLSVLEEEGILPNKITGSSAGALIGGVFASGLSTDQIKEMLFGLKKESFWDPIGFGGFLKGKKFKNILYETLPVKNMKDTRIDFSLSAYNIIKKRIDVLSDGDLIKAIYASCAVPFMFQPIMINKNFYLDGGLKDRPGLNGVEANERVFYHHIISNSPWRKKSGKSTQIPKRENMISLAIKNLPKVRPNNLKSGVLAYNKAKESMRKVLDMDISDIIYV